MVQMGPILIPGTLEGAISTAAEVACVIHMHPSRAGLQPWGAPADKMPTLGASAKRSLSSSANIRALQFPIRVGERSMRIVLSVLIGVHSLAYGADSHSMPKCLAEFCLREENLPTEEMLRARFGGFRTTPSPWKGLGYCYRFTTGDRKTSYGQFLFKKGFDTGWRLVTIRLSQEPICSRAHVVRVESPPSTREGIRLGADEGGIQKIYGRATFVLSPPPKDVVDDFFGYSSKMAVHVIHQYTSSDDRDLSSARFYVSNRQVVGIEISVDE